LLIIELLSPITATRKPSNLTTLAFIYSLPATRYSLLFPAHVPRHDDALRKELTAAGWSMLDSKTDYKLEPLKQ
jgi:hypothetical protein